MGIRIVGLEPKIDENCTLLILGSFPSTKSLEMMQYYANPKNHFWEIIESVFKIPAILPYGERISALKKKGIGLWDVIESCERTGSSDDSITNEKPNDLLGLFNSFPNINHIIFNGKKAQITWKKWFGDRSEDPPFNHVQFEGFPSTSPRNTKKREKFLFWSRLNRS